MAKEKSMSDLDKELNFDDIAGKKKSQAKPPKKKQVSGKTAETTGTVLAIPTDDPKAWICKDLADCNGEEFVTWAKGVYPVDLSHTTELFDKLSKRIHMFKGILYYHTTSLFQTGKEGKKNTTVH